MSTTQFADAVAAGPVLASRESDGMAHNDWRELAARENDGLEVSLRWSKSADRVKVAVADASSTKSSSSTSQAPTRLRPSTTRSRMRLPGACASAKRRAIPSIYSR